MKSFSATKISDWRLCARKAFLRHVLRLPAPPHPSAELGSRVHKVAETSILSRTQPDPNAGREEALAARLLATLPVGVEIRPQDVERRFELAVRGVAWTGVVDIFRPGAIPIVRDWKTTGDFRYAKTAEDLLTDPQAMLYAWAASVWTHEERRTLPPAVRLEWAYVCTGGQSGRGTGKTRVVEQTIVRDHLHEKLDQIVDEAKAIVRLGLAPADEEKHQKNPGACGAYGGCPYQCRCWAGTQRIPFALGAEKGKSEQMGYLEDLKRKQAAKTGAGANTGVNPTEAPQHASARDVHEISKRALPKIGLPDGIPEADAARWEGDQRDKACAWLGEVVCAADDAALEELFGSCPLAVEGWLNKQANEGSAEGSTEQAAEPPPQPRKPRKKKKADMVVTKETGVRVVEEGLLDGKSLPPPKIDLDEGASVGIGVLFVDCAPTGAWGFRSAPRRAADIVASLEPIGSAPHYRLEEYGRGPALAELALGEHLRQTGFECVVVDSQSAVGRDLLAVFERHARCVVRGLR